MALVTTAGASNADSYASLAEADAYFAARGVTTWTGSDGAKENALRKGATYLDNIYRLLWRGVRYLQNQSLAWPRVDGSRNGGHAILTPIVDTDGFDLAVDTVPTQIKNAQCEAAFLALTGVDLLPTLERGGAIKSIGKSVGSLRKDIVYADGASPEDRYLAIEGWLRGLVTDTPGSTSGIISLVRG